jgi:hypothetical protein
LATRSRARSLAPVARTGWPSRAGAPAPTPRQTRFVLYRGKSMPDSSAAEPVRTASPRGGVVLRLCEWDIENHGWREGPPLTVPLRESRSAGRAFTLGSIQHEREKNTAFVSAAAIPLTHTFGRLFRATKKQLQPHETGVCRQKRRYRKLTSNSGPTQVLENPVGSRSTRKELGFGWGGPVKRGWTDSPFPWRLADNAILAIYR